ALAELGGPETLLHGDLWAINVFVLPTATGLQARLIDWDHAAVGPIIYDLSTFLLRFPANERPWILDSYRAAIAPAGWQLPGATDLNLMFETAELARFANRIINADDFGASRGINRGILEAHERGILTSTSLLVDWPASEEAAALSRTA